jgi:hypothetical protein
VVVSRLLELPQDVAQLIECSKVAGEYDEARGPPLDRRA